MINANFKIPEFPNQLKDGASLVLLQTINSISLEVMKVSQIPLS